MAIVSIDLPDHFSRDSIALAHCVCVRASLSAPLVCDSQNLFGAYVFFCNYIRLNNRKFFPSPFDSFNNNRHQFAFIVCYLRDGVVFSLFLSRSNTMWWR